MNLEIIVPARNEEKNLEPLVKEIYRVFQSTGINFSINIIIDPSTDGTLKVASNLQTRHDRVRFEIKTGKPGKGYSIIQGAENAKTKYIAFIDADLQYPPSALPEMLKMLDTQGFGVVVANRAKHATHTLSRKIISKANKYIFGKLLHGLDTDTQSGLKVFRREVFEAMNKDIVGPWTFDMPLLVTCKELGLEIGNFDIEFTDRLESSSKVNVLRASYQIGLCALKLKFTEHIFSVTHENPEIGHTTIYKKKHFHTHNKLPHNKSALYTFSMWQKAVIWSFILLGVYISITNILLSIQIVIAALTFIYFCDFALSLYLVRKSLKTPPEIVATEEELNALQDEDLPIYTVLSPLYKEHEILPHFVEAISKMHWPKDKLDVMLLLEENDQETIDVARSIDLPDYFRIVVVPHSMPKTKPKACNYGLKFAKGELVTIYDAEDKPDVYQLKKAYLAFKNGSDNLVCVQGKLNYFNKHHNLLTRFFTAEYSLWFEVMLPSLQSINTIIPLGGTSNHFKTDILRKLHGWDPFNVTEDCDLGVRLFKEGYLTAIIDSVTYEEANSNVKNWIRQRSRWLKGYLQTYFVHMRNPIEFVRSHKGHSILFQLVIGLRISFILINPLMWALTASYFIFYDTVGLFIESLYPAPVFYLAVLTLVFGNFFYVYNYMIGLAAHKHWDLIKYVFFVPVYWLLMSFAAVKAFNQLIFNPHYWEKTNHGLHMKKKKGEVGDAASNEVKEAKEVKESVPNAVEAPVIEKPLSLQPAPKKSKNIPNSAKFGYRGLMGFLTSNLHRIPLIKKMDRIYVMSGGILVFGSLLANFLNFVYNAVLSRSLSLEDFGLVSLIGNLLFLVTIPFNSLSRTMSYKTAYLLGQSSNEIRLFWATVRNKALILGVLIFTGWFYLTPLLNNYFNASSMLPFYIFAPVLLVGLAHFTNMGYLSGNHKFSSIGLLLSLESVFKLALTIVFIWLGLKSLVYVAITASILGAFLMSTYFSFRIKGEKLPTKKLDTKFPFKFYLSSILIGFSLVAFISFDLILAKHYLNPVDAGLYALISLTGKMIYLIGTLTTQFIVPVIGKKEGAKENSLGTFYLILKFATLSSFAMFIFFGVLGKFTGPLLFGPNILPVVGLLPLYGMGILFFTVATTFTSYHQTRGNHLFSVSTFLLSILYVLGIVFYHDSLLHIVLVTAVAGVISFAVTLVLHFVFVYKVALVLNVRNIFGLFAKLPKEITTSGEKPTVLIFNWRDINHKWAGGAEVYVHELGIRLVQEGHKVVVFCGNDHDSKPFETVEGIHTIRRGGFFMVYVWAAVYYVLKLRKHVDIVIDSENGVPFFSPLYVKKPVIGLVHHVHSTVFEENLPKPLAMFAKFLESGVMPIAYRNKKMIAVSDSTKSDMEKLGFGKKRGIDIVYPGVDIDKFVISNKAEDPTILYLGRLKPYKSIDTIIKAFPKVLKENDKAKLKIAGFGESLPHLKTLSEELNVSHAVEFLGRVTEEEKVKLLSEAWVFVYPSSMEGWGISVIEANASGTPVVAANVPGLRDSVQNPHSGYLVPHNDVLAFSEKILFLISNDNVRKEFSEGAVEWSKNFTWDKSVKKLLVTLEDVHSAHKKNEKRTK